MTAFIVALAIVLARAGAGGEPQVPATDAPSMVAPADWSVNDGALPIIVTTRAKAIAAMVATGAFVETSRKAPLNFTAMISRRDAQALALDPNKTAGYVLTSTMNDPPAGVYAGTLRLWTDAGYADTTLTLYVSSPWD